MCEYCTGSIFNGTTPLIGDRDDVDGPLVYIEGDRLAMEFEQVVDYTDIDVCPKCGRDLRS